MPLRIYKRKNSPNWYIRGTVRGIPVDESAKTGDRDAAEALRIKRESEILNRSVFGAKATATFLEVAVSYMETVPDRRFVMTLVEHFGATALGRINQAAIDDAARTLYPDAAASTLNRQVYTPVSAILNHAAAKGLCDRIRLRRPKQSKGRVRWLRLHETEKLISACTPHLCTIVIFMLYTGARTSEAIYLDWQNVSLADRRVWFVDTKNDESRGVPLHERVIAELAKLEHREGNVFLRRDGKPYVYRGKRGGQIKEAFDNACQKAGIDDFTPHDLRHTWATWQYMSRRNFAELKELGGWKSDAMVFRYAHVNPDHLADAIDILPWEKSVK